MRIAEHIDKILSCSTPYGIRGLGTRWVLGQWGRYNPCSTPYGIRGLGTNGGIGTESGMSSAQRLTASEVWALQKSRFPWCQ